MARSDKKSLVKFAEKKFWFSQVILTILTQSKKYILHLGQIVSKIQQHLVWEPMYRKCQKKNAGQGN